jgi:hypothetical protein
MRALAAIVALAVSFADGAPIRTTASRGDNSAPIAYRSTLNCSPRGAACYYRFPPVPAGHRLMVQRVSGTLLFASAPNVVQVTVSGPPRSGVAFQARTMGRISVFEQSVGLEIDAASSPTVLIVAGDAVFEFAPNPSQPVTLSGYLLELSDNARSQTAE